MMKTVFEFLNAHRTELIALAYVVVQQLVLVVALRRLDPKSRAWRVAEFLHRALPLTLARLAPPAIAALAAADEVKLAPVLKLVAPAPAQASVPKEDA